MGHNEDGPQFWLRKQDMHIIQVGKIGNERSEIMTVCKHASKISLGKV